jgi:hypothetical protein
VGFPERGEYSPTCRSALRKVVVCSRRQSQPQLATGERIRRRDAGECRRARSSRLHGGRIGSVLVLQSDEERSGLWKRSCRSRAREERQRRIPFCPVAAADYRVGHVRPGNHTGCPEFSFSDSDTFTRDHVAVLSGVCHRRGGRARPRVLFVGGNRPRSFVAAGAILCWGIKFVLAEEFIFYQSNPQT